MQVHPFDELLWKVFSLNKFCPAFHFALTLNYIGNFQLKTVLKDVFNFSTTAKNIMVDQQDIHSNG